MTSPIGRSNATNESISCLQKGAPYNYVPDLVMSTEEKIVTNVKIGDKIDDYQTVYFSIET